MKQTKTTGRIALLLIITLLVQIMVGEGSLALLAINAAGKAKPDKLEIPQNIKMEAAETAITVSWYSVEGAESYDIKLNDSITEGIEETEYDIEGLTPGTEYRIQVRAVDKKKTGEWSEELKQTTLEQQEDSDGLPAIPDNIETEAEETAIALTWDEAAYADSYEIQLNGSIAEKNITVTEYVYAGLEPDTECKFRLRSRNKKGTSEWSTEIIERTLPSAGEEKGVGIGLIAEYFEKNTLEDPVRKRIDKEVEFDWGSGSPDSEIKKETFSVRWAGKIQPQKTGKHTIYTFTNGGIRLWIDGKQIIDDWEGNGERENSGKINLDAEQKYEIVMEYCSYGGGAAAKLYWSNAGQEKQIIPQAQLYCLPEAPAAVTASVTQTTATLAWEAALGAASYEIETEEETISGITGLSREITGLAPDTQYTYRIRSENSLGYSGWSEAITVTTLPEETPQTVAGNGIKGEYYKDKEFTELLLTRNDDAVNFNWGSNPPDPNISQEKFAVRWTGMVKAKYTDAYTVHTCTDDGVRLWIDGQLLIEDWGKKGERENTAQIYLEAGKKYDIKLEYCQNKDSAKAILYWSSPRQPKQIIPKAQLYRTPDVPENLEATSNSTKNTLTWDRVTGAEWYEIEADGAVVNTGLETNYTHTGLMPNTAHTYRVRAANEAGTGEWSGSLTKTTAPAIPKEITFAASSITITVRWGTVTAAEAYDIEAEGTVIENGSSTEYNHKGLSPNTEYTYRVRAKNVNGTSDWSEYATQRTAPHIPENIKAESTTRTITITWDVVSEADSYEIELDGTAVENGSKTAYEYTGLLPNTPHNLRVRAINEIGPGDWSTMKTWYTAPDIPKNLGGTSNSTSITITWDSVEAAAGYEIEINGTAVDAGNVTAYTHTNLNPNTQRAYRIRAKNAYGKGDWSEIIARTTLPGTPTNIETERTETGIKFTWDISAGATSYEVKFDDRYENVSEAEYIADGLAPYTVHTFAVRAKNAEGAGEWSGTISESTLMPVPENINAEASDTTVTISWTYAINNTSFEIEADGITTDNQTAMTYIHRELTPNTTHTYRIRAITGENSSRWSLPLNVTTLPGIPEKLSTAAASTKIAVTWSEVPGAVGYDIEADGTVIENLLQNAYTHENLAPNTVHTYRVRAAAEGGIGRWSEAVSVATLLGIPENLTASTTGDSIQISWDEVSGATGYEIEVDGETEDISGARSYKHEGLDANTVHVYRVRAKSGGYSGEWSPRINVTTKLSAPDDLTVRVTDKTLDISWDAVDGAEEYKLAVNGKTIEELSGTSYLYTGAEANTKYIVKVKAENEENTSELSEAVTAYTAPAVPQNLKAAVAGTAITVTWDAVPGATGYDVEADGIVTDNKTSLAYRQEGLTPNTLHTYRVRAKNEYSSGEWSAEVRGSTAPELVFNCAEDNLFNFVIAAPKVGGTIERTITVTYIPEELEAVDFCAATSNRDIEIGEIPGTNLTVKEFTPGTIVFNLKDSSKAIMNAVKFKAKLNGQSKILYVIE